MLDPTKKDTPCPRAKEKPQKDSCCRLVAKTCPTLVTTWTVACQVPVSMGFSRQEYWNGLPFPSPADLPNPGIKPRSPALQADSLPIEPWRKHKDGRRGEIAFRINPYTSQGGLEGSNKTLCAPGNPTETEPDLPLSVWVSPVKVQVSSGLSQGWGLWVWQTWVWHKPFWRMLPLTPPELIQDWGDRLLEGTNKTLCSPGPRTKEQWHQKRLTQTCLWVSRSLWWRRGSAVACCRVGGTECSSACMGHFEGGHHYLHYLHHSLVSGQTTGREHSPAHQQKNWIKDLLSMAPPIRKRTSFPLSQSPSSGSFHKPLILIHQRADRMKTTITEN